MSAGPARGASQVIPFAAILFAGILVGSITMRFVTPPPPAPPRIAPIFASRDSRDPAVTPDGRAVVVATARGLVAIPFEPGRPERPLAPEARTPRFTFDGSAILFTRDEADGVSLWVAPAAGGRARPLLADAFDADPSPDGRWLACLRTTGSGDSLATLVVVSDSTGAGAREIHREPGAALRGPRWSPDGKRIAVTVDARSGVPGRVLLMAVGEETRALSLPPGAAGASVGAWVDSKRYVYAVPAPPESRWPAAGSSLRVHHVKRDRSYEAAWVPHAIERLDASPDGRLVLATAPDSTGASALLRVDRVPGLGRPSR